MVEASDFIVEEEARQSSGAPLGNEESDDQVQHPNSSFYSQVPFSSQQMLNNFNRDADDNP